MWHQIRIFRQLWNWYWNWYFFISFHFIFFLCLNFWLRNLILTLNKTKRSTALVLPKLCNGNTFLNLSNKGLKPVLFGGASKTLPKSFSKPFDKKTTEKLKKFREVSQLFGQFENSVNCDYYTSFELNNIKVKQEDWSSGVLVSSVFLYYLPTLMTWKTF